MTDIEVVELATDLTIAWLTNPQTRVEADEVPAFLNVMHRAVSDLARPSSSPEIEVPTHLPAVSIRKSLADPSHIISMLDGKPYKTLKRHLARHGLTPTDYRDRYGLKADYPMTAPAYSAARTAIAKALGLGRKKGETTMTSGPSPSQKSAAKAVRKSSAIKTAVQAKKAAVRHLTGK